LRQWCGRGWRRRSISGPYVRPWPHATLDAQPNHSTLIRTAIRLRRIR
jgi:hypothetical protein